MTVKEREDKKERVRTIERSNDRKKEIKKIKEEGRAAYLAGKRMLDVPSRYIGFIDKFHWEDGWKAEQESYKEKHHHDLPAVL